MFSFSQDEIVAATNAITNKNFNFFIMVFFIGLSKDKNLG
jgi:hypothetical protein